MIVVEHDEDAIRLADYVVDIGPGAGVHGGRVVAEGTPDEVMNHPDSLTGKYLSGREKIRYPATRTPRDKKKLLKLKGARGNLMAIRVDEQVRNLSQLKPGDVVSIDYYQAVAIDAKKASGTPGVTERTTVTRARSGEKPGGVALRKVHVITEVMGVNTDTQTILVRGPLGHLTEVKVNNPELFSELQAGGRVDLTYVEGLAIAVREGPKK